MTRQAGWKSKRTEQMSGGLDEQKKKQKVSIR
jgi:hypothetical protein